ncbi:C-type lectin domain family 4 member E [Biomphalaria glabrata]|nr:C-type lectin domain family 4 member E [Biomphalaria glabrata]
MATAFMLAHPYGMPRIMSSYEYNRANNYEGPPHNSDMTTASVQMSGMRCTNGWSCEHRWRQIYNMVGFRNLVSGTALENWWSGADYQIAFSRGDKGFIALNLEGFDINQNLQTGLPAGRYCDVISGDIDNDRCTGKTVEVYNDGTAHINVCSNCDDPVLAIHVALSAFTDPHCIGGRDGIVHLFEWRWNDIAAECERFLGPYGFCAVQTSPANENRIVTNPYRPWWERYQPVSYKINTRSGSEDEFRNMVEKCNNSGVRIYVDIVINHMTESGGQGFGTNGTFYDADNLQFPGVPFGPTDFNDGSLCHSGDLNIHNYGNAEEVRNCRLVGLHGGLLDLKMGKDYVRDEVSGYLNRLVDFGVAGFRVDAAKHMWPGDLIVLFSKVKDLPIGGRPFVYQEVIDQGGEPIKAEEYFATGRVTNFKFGLQLANVFRRQNAMKYLSNWGTGWGMWASDSVVNFIDNHDNQRGHGGGGGVLTHWDPKPYKMATAFMLAHPYGMPRIMSSYEYNRANNYEGPPHNSDMSTASVQISGMICTNGWSCEHRG